MFKYEVLYEFQNVFPRTLRSTFRAWCKVGARRKAKKIVTKIACYRRYKIIEIRRVKRGQK